MRFLAQALDQHAAEEARDDGEGLELRVELRDCELHLPEGFAAQRKRSGQSDAVPPRDLDEPFEHRVEADLTEGAVPEALEKRGELELEPGQVDVRHIILAEHEHRLGEKARVLAPEGEHEHEHELSHLWRELADHAEVKEIDLVVPPAQVPGMRVGVKEPVTQDLAVIRLEELASRLARLGALGGFAQRHALHLLHDQESLVEKSPYTRGTASLG